MLINLFHWRFGHFHQIKVQHAPAVADQLKGLRCGYRSISVSLLNNSTHLVSNRNHLYQQIHKTLCVSLRPHKLSLMHYSPHKSFHSALFAEHPCLPACGFLPHIWQDELIALNHLVLLMLLMVKNSTGHICFRKL